MNPAEVMLKRAQKHVEAFEDWKTDHDAAMGCAEFEDWMSEASGVYDMLESADTRVRRLAYDGAVSPASGWVTVWRTLYEVWHARAAQSLPELTRYEELFGDVPGAAGFRDRIDRAWRALDVWADPVRAIAPGVQVWHVTDADAAALSELMQGPAGAPGTLTREPTPMPAGANSLIR